MNAPVADYTAALIDGPWRHEFVSANGSRFHVALAGPDTGAHRDAPLIVFLHGFPQFWWAWRHQIQALASSGYRLAAMDLRGAGASDKPPLGYDAPAQTRDIAGVIRALGAGRAIVVGHGAGGELAWAMAALQPAVIAGVVAVCAPHPARMHVAGWRLATGAALRQLAFCQLPTFPERALTSGNMVAQVLAAGAAGQFPAQAAAIYHTVMQIPFSAHSALEAIRWSVRSVWRPDGRRYRAALRSPIAVPALQVHAGRDGFVRRNLADADGAALARDFRFEVIPDAGHFLPEEAPDAVSALLLDWLDDVGPRVT